MPLPVSAVDTYDFVNFSEEDMVFYGKVIGITDSISFEGDTVESLIEDFLKTGTAETSKRILAVMQMEAEKYTAEIFDKLSEYEYDPEMVKLHIIGGGGCLIRNFGTYDPSGVEIITDICATAKGYEYMALVTLNRNGGVI